MKKNSLANFCSFRPFHLIPITLSSSLLLTSFLEKEFFLIEIVFEEKYDFLWQYQINELPLSASKNESGTMTELQHTSYYPFGGIIADLSTGRDVQNRMYNGKEQDFSNNLFWLDYGARQYDPTRGQFANYDPHCESYYNTNPLTYCGNNPIGRIDPTGMDWYQNEDGTAAFRQEGADESVTVGDVTYNNVGQNFNITYDLGDGTSYTLGFEQNVLQSSSIPIGRIYGNMEDNSEGWVDNVSSIVSNASTLASEYAKMGYNKEYGHWKSASGKLFSFSLLNRQENGKFVQGVQGYRNSERWAFEKSSKLNNISKKLGKAALVTSFGNFMENPTWDNSMIVVDNAISLGKMSVPYAIFQRLTIPFQMQFMLNQEENIR